MHPKNAIITLGYLGTVVLEEDKKIPEYFPGEHVHVVDETAAGDAFRAAFITEYFERKDVKKAMKLANRAGAFAVTRLGSYVAMPTREQLEFFRP